LRNFVVWQFLVVFQDHRWLRAVGEEQRREPFGGDHQCYGLLVLHDRRDAEHPTVLGAVVRIPIGDVDDIMP
jgi:hypothetical protein